MYIEKNKGVERYDVTGSSEGVLHGSIHRTMGSFRVRTGPGRGLRTYVKRLCHVIRVGTISWQWRVGSVQNVSWMYF